MSRESVSASPAIIGPGITLPNSSSYSPGRRAAARLLRSKGGLTGGGFIIILILLAIFAPWATPYDPIKLSPSEALTAPSWTHLAGTDRFGRDILGRIIFGARISLQIGLVGVSIGALLGTLLGLIAGYYGGWVDALITMLLNILLALPGILLALVIVAALGAGLQNIMIAVGISSIPRYALLIRGRTRVIRQEDFIEAARALGCTDRRIILQHILPNVLAPLVVLSTLGLATAVLIGASVSYLGLGAQPPTPEWGIMVNDGKNLLRQAWWLSTMPGLAILVTVIALNLLGDSLRDALDPGLKM